MEAISAASMELIALLDCQNISNTLWAFAALVLGNAPLLAALSAAARRRIVEFETQEISNTAWS